MENAEDEAKGQACPLAEGPLKVSWVELVLQESSGLMDGLATGSNFLGRMGTSPQGGSPGALKSKARLFPLSNAHRAPLMDGMNCPRSKEISCTSHQQSWKL
jgi:hypothetical protein